MENPRILCFTIVNDCMAVGSNTDGLGSVNEGWKHRSSMYHLAKASGHLATHIKHKVCGTNDGEYHLALALTRLAMAASIEKHESQKQRNSKDT